ncbi:hypothetical protein TgHK011_006792 [Trichoderma gracile]|nr:hypothetical protein TgHK011_006792 [Trichoderma gracile]
MRGITGRCHLAGEEVHDRPRAWVLGYPCRTGGANLPITPIPVFAAPAKDLSDTSKSPVRDKMQTHLQSYLTRGRADGDESAASRHSVLYLYLYEPLQRTPAPQSVRRSNSRLSLLLVNLCPPFPRPVRRPCRSLPAAHKPEAIDGSEMMRCDARCRAWNCRFSHASPLLLAREDR